MHDHDLLDDDLAWLAFRYVAGELNAAERAQFESLLAESQAAREAVASAVALAQATAIALAQPPATRASRRWHASRWAWAATAAAACIALVWGALQWQNGVAPASSPKADALAARWSEVRQQQSSHFPWDDSPWDDSADEPADIGSDLALHLDVAEDRSAQALAAPEWMLAAVLEQRQTQNMVDDMPGDIERGGEESQEQ